jgi:hypothetical protein
MKITTSPQSGFPSVPETTASVAGDVVTVNGIAYDMSAVPEGGEATPTGEHPFIGTITRTGGEISASIRWEYGHGAASDQPTDPEHYVISVADGPVPSPIVMEDAE